MKIVLIVDDELCKPANAEVFKREYCIEDIEYRFAGTGDEMFQILAKESSVSLILLDIRFEGEQSNHGLELLKQLSDRGHPIPIVMMSSLSRAEILIKAWDLGADSYLLKWSSNPQFCDQFREKVLLHTRKSQPSSRELVERKRNKIKTNALYLQKAYGYKTTKDIIDQAIAFKQDIGGQWINKPSFPADFQNYVKGWNETDSVLNDAEANHRLLFLNMDFGDGCTLRCPHCFTHEGVIDDRGRTPIPYGRIKDTILEAKELGLKHVRILGRGEPTQWISNPGRHVKLAPNEGEDLIDFVRFLAKNEITPLIFTRGQIIGDDKMIELAFGGKHGVNSGEDLARLLYQNGASIFLGVSSIFPEINDEMVGIPRTQRYDYDKCCRRSLQLTIAAEFNQDKPTRLAVEMPITNLNIREMGVRYILFQMMNISPCANVYMVAGRAMTYGLGEITDPPQDEFVDAYAMIVGFSERMGINQRIGPYAGTKECHDVSCGMYLTLNGDIYPCPGYEGVHNFVGSLQTHSIREIWENNLYGGHAQSICPPKIGTHFPPDFEKRVLNRVQEKGSELDELYSYICQELG